MNNGIIIFLGIAGSGKSTIARKLAEKHTELKYIASGDIVRRLHESGKLTSDDVKRDIAYISEHGLSRHESHIREEIYKGIEENNKTVILDGYPRSADQMLELVGRFNKTLPFYFINIATSPLVSLNRIVTRGRGEVNPERIMVEQSKSLIGLIDFIMEEELLATPVLELNNDYEGDGYEDIINCIYSYYKAYEKTLTINS